MKVNVMTLENGKDYIIIDTLEDGDNKYLFYVNEQDALDICIRKVVFRKINGKNLQFILKTAINQYIIRLCKII